MTGFVPLVGRLTTGILMRHDCKRGPEGFLWTRAVAPYSMADNASVFAEKRNLTGCSRDQAAVCPRPIVRQRIGWSAGREGLNPARSVAATPHLRKVSGDLAALEHLRST